MRPTLIRTRQKYEGRAVYRHRATKRRERDARQPSDVSDVVLLSLMRTSADGPICHTTLTSRSRIPSKRTEAKSLHVPSGADRSDIMTCSAISWWWGGNGRVYLQKRVRKRRQCHAKTFPRFVPSVESMLRAPTPEA